MTRRWHDLESSRGPQALRVVMMFPAPTPGMMGGFGYGLDGDGEPLNRCVLITSQHLLLSPLDLCSNLVRDLVRDVDALWAWT